MIYLGVAFRKSPRIAAEFNSSRLNFTAPLQVAAALELAPPYVQTELMGEHQANDPRAMPLAGFIAEVMDILATQPEAKEILVRNVNPLRFAGDFNSEKFYGFFENFNAAMARH